MPTSCASSQCARAVSLVSESCGALFASATWKIFSAPLKDSLDAATKVCAGAGDTAPHRYAVTDPASATVAAVSLGATITDGMGAGGRNSTFGQDSATVQAAPGGTAGRRRSRSRRCTSRTPATT